MSVLEFIRRQLLRYRDLLANLSRRNKELFFREGRGYSINLSKPPNVDNEFSELVAEKFHSLRATSEQFHELIKNGSFNLTEHFLLNETGNPDLVKRLDKVRLADDKFQREYGISGAWLLGPFLCWRDKAGYQPEDLLISPVFKIPVDLNKDKRKQWKLELEDPVLRINPSLQLALRQKWGISLPDQFETEHVIDALEELKKALSTVEKKLHLEGYKYDAIPKIPPRFKFIKNEDGEIIEKQPVKLEENLSAQDLEIYKKTTHADFTLIDVLYVDHLSASRTVLIHDYDSIMESSEAHPILSELFLGKAIPGEKSAGRERIKALDGYKERENYFVVNIDSTQHRAIDQASKSRAIVIQGPPGTGKSQTITNLIAENLAKGKRVLFVSEKRPALDVVFSRLQQANLESQAVLIHGSDLNKQDLYSSFLELSNSVHDHTTDQKWEQTAANLDRLKSDLNGYFELLEIIHQPSGLILSDLLVRLANTSDGTINPGIAKLFFQLDSNDLQRVNEIFDELEIKVKSVHNYGTHPWLYRKAQTIYSETLVHSLSDLLKRLKETEGTLRHLGTQLKGICAIGVDLLPDVNILQKASTLIVPREWCPAVQSVYLDDQVMLSYEQQVTDPVRQIEREKDQFSLIRADADAEIVRELESYYSISRGFFDWFTPTFWRMRRYRCQYCPQWQNGNRPFKAFRIVNEAIRVFKTIVQTRRFPVVFDETQPRLVLDAHNQALVTLQIASELGQLSRKIGLSQQSRFAIFSEDVNRELCACLKEVARLKVQINQSQQVHERLRVELSSYFESFPSLSTSEDNSSVYDELFRTVKDLDKLDQIDLCLTSIQKINNTILPKDFIISQLLPIEQKWGGFVTGAVVRAWVDDLRSKHPALRTFDSVGFHKKAEQFKKIESDHRVAAREVVNNTFSKRWNRGMGESEGLGLLTKESNKQRRVLSPREIMERGALGAMMKLKPCWLMSPLSISQILPLKAGLFDLIIFDEASQVRVEDAVPSIYRANSMVVVGDPKQMPPTNFFASHETQDDEEEEIEIAVSVLDLAAQIYPSEILEWHYRSRAEALIAFSNRAFYGGRLIAVPNPHFITEGDAIKFHSIAEAYFNQKEGNLVEANAIAKRLLEVLESYPECSVGIIAMGQVQMVAIEDAIEQLANKDPRFQSVLDRARSFKDGEADAGLFVKNLENVQGDERDIILISVGYAASRAGKKVYQNFGPLSKQGGGRRLNVAVTRAKQKIEVFCSFDPSQISTDEAAFGKNPDLTLFGRYLKYAAAISGNRIAEALSILDSFGVGGVITTKKSSNFSKDVQRRLVEIGYKVTAEIGSSGFYIDLGVHHPIIPSNFVLGIECDGAMFHSTPYARDRDKIRQELLEARGWKIVRVWSQDWSKDWKTELARIDNTLKKILSGVRVLEQPKLKMVQ